MPRDDFETIFTLTDPDGLVTATVTTHRDSAYPRLTCAFQRAYEKNGQAEGTYWLLKRHLLILLDLIPEVIDRMELEEEKIRVSQRQKKRELEVQGG